tara:strand:- start:1335 stop:1730 length:396 start_codon:yes stop_codon:yes gene_type:complete
MKNIKAQIEEILKDNPNINYKGISLPQLFNKKESPTQRKERLEMLREALLSDVACVEVANVVKWLRTSKKARRTKLMNTKYSSFGLKTYVEQDMGMEISNGSFIVGAMICGCRAEQVKTSENAILNLRIKA